MILVLWSTLFPISSGGGGGGSTTNSVAEGIWFISNDETTSNLIIQNNLGFGVDLLTDIGLTINNGNFIISAIIPSFQISNGLFLDDSSGVNYIESPTINPSLITNQGYILNDSFGVNYIESSTNYQILNIFIYRQSYFNEDQSGNPTINLYSRSTLNINNYIISSSLPSPTTWWNLYELSGTRFDSTINANNLNNNNTPIGYYGASYGCNFNGSNQYLYINDNSTLHLTSFSFSICCCVYLNALAGSGSFNYIINKDTPSSSNREWQLYYYNSGISSTSGFQFALFNTAISYFQTPISGTSFTTTINTWYLLIATCDTSTNTITLNVYNSNSSTPISSQSTTYSGTLNITTAPIYIGASQVSSYYFNGYMKNIGLFGGNILNSTQQQLIWNNGFFLGY